MQDAANDKTPMVYAVVGLCGVGKSEATHYIARTYDAEIVYFGGLVTEEVRNRGLEPNQDNERTVREDLRRKHGMGVMAKLSLPKVKALIEQGKSVVIDGLYSSDEWRILDADGAFQLFVIAIHSRRELRYVRMSKREVRPLNAEEVDRRDYWEIETLDKARPIVLAHHHIVNDGSMADLGARLDEILGGR